MSRMESVGGAQEELLTADLTVGFADLVGFTELTNRLDDDDLANMVESFESRCSDLITASGGRAVKTLGDSVLFVAEDPQAAVAIALDIVEELGPDSRLPDVRVGLASGTVITRLGDVYGPPVNRAARLTTVAQPEPGHHRSRDRSRTVREHVRDPTTHRAAAAWLRRGRAGDRTAALELLSGNPAVRPGSGRRWCPAPRAGW
jgi:class 3 adenylate cyclase